MPAEGEPPSRSVNRVDLSAPPNHTFQVSMAREEYPSDRRLRQFKDLVLFIFSVTLASIIAWMCCSTLLAPIKNVDEQKWAMSILSGMMGGIIGYLLKR